MMMLHVVSLRKLPLIVLFVLPHSPPSRVGNPRYTSLVGPFVVLACRVLKKDVAQNVANLPYLICGNCVSLKTVQPSLFI